MESLGIDLDLLGFKQATSMLFGIFSTWLFMLGKTRREERR